MSAKPLVFEDRGVLGLADEKQFYLQEFRNRTLLVSLDWPSVDEGHLQRLRNFIEELLENGTRVILCFGTPPGSALEGARERLQANWASLLAPGSLLPGMEGAADLASQPIAVTEPDPTLRSEILVRAWLNLRQHPLWIVLVAATRADSHLAFGEQLAAALRVHKWVIVDPAGGIRDRSGAMLSFMDATLLETLLTEGQAEWAGLGARRPIFAAAYRALVSGTGSVNLCDLDGLERELFTYLGSGTLFTLSDYCCVQRLTIDDYPAVEQLLWRGEQEGVLKPRSLVEIARILVHGYGATIGGGHLAGICSLETEPYRDQRAGEVVALYTITRFKGEGIGRKLLARVTADAKAMGLDYLFACTSVPQARAFFEREGFRVVAAEEVPAAKWRGYDRERRKRVTVLRKDLASGTQGD